jgi:hypothetical protein
MKIRSSRRYVVRVVAKRKKDSEATRRKAKTGSVVDIERSVALVVGRMSELSTVATG